MKVSFEGEPYLDKKGNLIDFSEKRLRFWPETVPSDIRRLEYDLYKINRRLIHANIYKAKNKKRYGRFVFVPLFSKELDYEEWKRFQGSFLKGEERRTELTQILGSVEKDIPILLKKYSDTIPTREIKLMALSGSSFIGPRRSGEELSDIDLNFLLDFKDNSHNFDIFPNENDTMEYPYHLFGTGYSDESRGEKRDVHWLLYPHLPVRNVVSNEELMAIIDQLVISTQKRKEEILASINKMEEVLESRSQESLID